MIHFLNNLIIIAFRYHQTSVEDFLIQQILNDISLKCAEDVTGTEMNPERFLAGCFCNGFTIILRQRITCVFPGLSIF